MKTQLSLTLAITLVAPAAFGQSLVNGTNYSDLFTGSPSNVTVNVPNAVLLTVSNASATGPMSPYWQATATGGASVLGGITESNAQVALTGSALQFNVQNTGLLGNLAGLTGLATAWSATATFDKAGNVLLLAPNTTYEVSFQVDGSNGLLNSTLGITPSFTFQFLDGAGNVVGSNSNGTLVNLVGLLGTGVTSGTVTVDFTTGATVNTSSAAALKFNGASTLDAQVLGLGTNFATVSNLSITQVPEPSSLGLVAFSALALLRRKR